MSSEFFGIASLVVTLVQYVPYCWKTYTGQLRPHAFSYVIWGGSAAIVAGAQWTAGAGPGAWAMALVTCLCFLVVVLSLRGGGAKYVTRKDVWTLICALCALPIWHFTRNPVFAVIVITIIDVAAFYMIFNKARTHPDEDSILFYLIAITQYTLSIFATSNFNVATLLNPVALIICAFVIMITLWISRIRPRAKPTHL